MKILPILVVLNLSCAALSQATDSDQNNTDPFCSDIKREIVKTLEPHDLNSLQLVSKAWYEVAMPQLHAFKFPIRISVFDTKAPFFFNVCTVELIKLKIEGANYDARLSFNFQVNTRIEPTNAIENNELLDVSNPHKRFALNIPLQAFPLRVSMSKNSPYARYDTGTEEWLMGDEEEVGTIAVEKLVSNKSNQKKYLQAVRIGLSKLTFSYDK